MIDNTIDFDYSIAKLLTGTNTDIYLQSDVLNSEHINNSFQQIENSLNTLYEKTRYLEDAIAYTKEFLETKIGYFNTEINSVLHEIENTADLSKTKNLAYISYNVPFVKNTEIINDRDGRQIKPLALKENKYLILNYKEDEQIKFSTCEKVSDSIPYNDNFETIKKVGQISRNKDESYRVIYSENQLHPDGLRESIVMYFENPIVFNSLDIELANCEIQNLTIGLINGTVEEIAKYDINMPKKKRVCTYIKFDLVCTNYELVVTEILKDTSIDNVWNNDFDAVEENVEEETVQIDKLIHHHHHCHHHYHHKYHKHLSKIHKCKHCDEGLAELHKGHFYCINKHCGHCHDIKKIHSLLSVKFGNESLNIKNGRIFNQKLEQHEIYECLSKHHICKDCGYGMLEDHKGHFHCVNDECICYNVEHDKELHKCFKDKYKVHFPLKYRHHHHHHHHHHHNCGDNIPKEEEEIIESTVPQPDVEVVPKPNENSITQTIKSYTYVFGIDSFIIRQAGHETDGYMISDPIYIGDIKEGDYIRLYVDHNKGDCSEISYSILDENIEVPIAIINEDYIENELLFGEGITTRFDMDFDTGPSYVKEVIKQNGAVVDISYNDAQKQALEAISNKTGDRYSVTYKPSTDQYDYQPMHNTIRVKCYIRNMNKMAQQYPYISSIVIRKYGEESLWTNRY